MAQLSLQELIIRKLSVQLNVPESIVEKVVNHKWKSVHEAQYLYTSVEDSGLGTFKIRSRVAINRIKKLEAFIKKFDDLLKQENLTEKEIAKYTAAIEKLQEEKKYTESKI